MKVYVESYGCAANQGDTSIMEGVLLERGHIIVDNVDDADAVLINTCTVIDTTQQRMMNRIRNLRKSGKPLVIAGCMASAQEEVVKRIAPDALLLSPRRAHSIADVLEGKRVHTRSPKVGVPRKAGLHLSVPIADGCSYRCSYCITKRARGNLTSYPLEGLANDIADAIGRGSREIRLTAQDTASYGRDSGCTLGELLEKISLIEGDFRVRVGMMHPRSAHEILDELLEAYRHEKIYKFLHLPLQSASPRILKAMRRGYDIETFMEVVEAFRNRFPRLMFATDIIVAFPGEREEDFLASVEAVKELQPDVVNITRFSPRPHTDAWHMKRMPTHIAKERSRILSRVADEIALEKNRGYIGITTGALVLGTYNGFSVGKTDSYKSVFVKGVQPGVFATVRVVDAAPTHLHAIYLNDDDFTYHD